MPTDWEWFAGLEGESDYFLACGCATRDAAIKEALCNACVGDIIQVIEARSSTAMKYEAADFVPFTRTRNRETIGRVGPDGCLIRSAP